LQLNLKRKILIDLVESFRIGLFLEPDNVWLNWNSKFEELVLIANPEIIKWGGPYKELQWKNKFIFQGLNFNVTTVFELDQDGKPFGGLKHFRFFSPNDLNPRSLALMTRDYFIQTIGVNPIDKSSGEEYYWAWEKKGVKLIVGIEERYSTVFHFHFELMD